MREIKFRAWNVKEKFMIDWSTMVQSSFNERYVSLLYNVITSNEDNYIVMQFTGLKDKNGTEIYEGDILKSMESIVKINYCGNSFVGENINEAWKPQLENKNYLHWEIIGNIHQNPELL